MKLVKRIISSLNKTILMLGAMYGALMLVMEVIEEGKSTIWTLVKAFVAFWLVIFLATEDD